MATISMSYVTVRCKFYHVLKIFLIIFFKVLPQENVEVKSKVLPFGVKWWALFPRLVALHAGNKGPHRGSGQAHTDVITVIYRIHHHKMR